MHADIPVGYKTSNLKLTYVGPCTVVTYDLWVVLAEAGIELDLTKVGKQLDSSALQQVLAEINHAV